MMGQSSCTLIARGARRVRGSVSQRVIWKRAHRKSQLAASRSMSYGLTISQGIQGLADLFEVPDRLAHGRRAGAARRRLEMRPRAQVGVLLLGPRLHSIERHGSGVDGNILVVLRPHVAEP